MNLKKHNQNSFWNGNSFPIIKQNLHWNFEFDRKVFGVGILLFRPIDRKFPRKNHWFGITIRLFWVSLMLKFLVKKPNKDNHEYFENMEPDKGVSAFYSK